MAICPEMNKNSPAHTDWLEGPTGAGALSGLIIRFIGQYKIQQPQMYTRGCQNHSYYKDLVQIFIGLDHDLPLVVQAAFVPVSSVKQMCFSSLLTNRDLRNGQFLMRSALTFSLL